MVRRSAVSVATVAAGLVALLLGLVPPPRT